MPNYESNIVTFSVPIDSPIVPIEYEQWVLGRQLQVASEQFGYLYNQTKARLEAELRARGLHNDEVERDLVDSDLDYLRDFLLPRVFWNPIITSGWAVYELGLKRVAQVLQKNRGVEKELGFMEKLRVNFSEKLSAPLALNDNDWANHAKFRTVRHAIAHANGSVEALKEKAQRSVTQWAKSDQRMDCYQGYIVVSEAFATDCVDLVTKALHSATAYIRPEGQ